MKHFREYRGARTAEELVALANTGGAPLPLSDDRREEKLRPGMFPSVSDEMRLTAALERTRYGSMYLMPQTLMRAEQVCPDCNDPNTLYFETDDGLVRGRRCDHSYWPSEYLAWVNRDGNPKAAFREACLALPERAEELLSGIALRTDAMRRFVSQRRFLATVIRMGEEAAGTIDASVASAPDWYTVRCADGTLAITPIYMTHRIVECALAESGLDRDAVAMDEVGLVPSPPGWAIVEYDRCGPVAVRRVNAKGASFAFCGVAQCSRRGATYFGSQHRVHLQIWAPNLGSLVEANMPARANWRVPAEGSISAFLVRTAHDMGPFSALLNSTAWRGDVIPSLAMVVPWTWCPKSAQLGTLLCTTRRPEWYRHALCMLPRSMMAALPTTTRNLGDRLNRIREDSLYRGSAW
jgi:hypothetical protein